MTSAGLCLVYLVWAPQGPEPVARFAESYRRHAAGVEHVVAVALKGMRAGQDRSPWERALEGVSYELLEMPDGVLDLGSYRQAAERVRAERYCFVNTASEILGEGWLGHLDRHLRGAGVGLVGAAGSYESAYSSAPRPLRPFRRDFDPFPNPHIRTNGFALTRELLASLDWSLPRRKLEAWRLESSRRGISAQVRERGLELVVVGRDGHAYPPERWRESATFRSGAQLNQMLGDNRTREYDTAPQGRRLQLEQMAWGRT
ncbi:MAG TPA: hypothetical protein VNU24_01050 [Solirubrobacteraceae bacterium]|jgi:hypothetical protein|nr:hypothetical protein [Solirubrobacteraceae bacterium]